jgi:hypothetical protein
MHYLSARPFAIGSQEGDERVMCMRCAMADYTVPDNVRKLLDQSPVQPNDRSFP